MIDAPMPLALQCRFVTTYELARRRCPFVPVSAALGRKSAPSDWRWFIDPELAIPDLRRYGFDPSVGVDEARVRRVLRVARCVNLVGCWGAHVMWSRPLDYGLLDYGRDGRRDWRVGTPPPDDLVREIMAQALTQR